MSKATALPPEASTGPDVVVGVDTHKHTHMAVALSGNGGWLGSLKLDAKRSGYQALMQWVTGFGSCPVFAVEGTGSYGAGLCRSLQSAGLEVVEVNRPDRSPAVGWERTTRSMRRPLHARSSLALLASSPRPVTT